MKKTSLGLVLWLAFEALVTFGVPCLLASLVPLLVTIWFVLFSCAWAVGWTWLFTRMSYRQWAMRWKYDCLVFASFVKHFRDSDPILAHALWQKIHPNIPPPWLSKEATTGTQDE